MVSKEMSRGGTIVAELPATRYRVIAGEVRKNLPPHMYIEIERVSERDPEKGKMIKIWCRHHPDIAKKIIANAQKALTEASKEATEIVGEGK